MGEGLQPQVNLFPNPAKETVAVQYNLSTTATITLYDLASGCYFIKVIDQNGNVGVEKVIKE